MASLIARKKGYGTYYYIRHTVDGKRKEIACGTQNRRRAEAIFREFRRGLLDQEQAVSEKAYTFSELRADYEAWSASHHRPATRTQYLWALDSFMRYSGLEIVISIKQSHIQGFIKERLATGAKPRTVNAAIVALRAMLNIAGEMGWYSGSNPFKTAKRLKEQKRHPRWLDKAQIDAVLANAELHSQDMLLIYALGIYAGLRKSEIVEARWEWFDWGNGLLHVRGSDTFVLKDQEDRTLPIHEKLREILHPFKAPSGYIIAPQKMPGKHRYRVEFKKGFAAVATAAGAEWCTPHILRHTFASQLASAGVSLKKIGVWMGHSGSAITDIYAHLQLDDTDINSF